MRPRKTSTDAKTRRTVAYVRVSTEEQANEGVSLAAQEARIAAYALAMGWEVASFIRDCGESAKSLRRPGMAQIIADVRAGSVERVAVLKLDRATRSLRDLADLLDLFKKHNASFVSVSENLDTTTASGRLVVNTLGNVAQWEREAIAERTGAALAYKRQRRQVYGAIPFGYTRVGAELIAEPREQAALDEARQMDCAGASYREIGAMLTLRGVMPHRGKAWHASSVRAILRSKMATEAAA